MTIEEINALSVEESKEKLYQTLLEISTVEGAIAPLKVKLKELEELRDSLFYATLEKVPEEDREAKIIRSEKMICREDQVVDKKIDIKKIAKLFNEDSNFNYYLGQAIGHEAVTFSGPTKIAKAMNKYASDDGADYSITADDIQSLVMKKEIILSPIEEATEPVELE